MTTDTSGKRVRIVIVGAGYVSWRHAAALSALDFVELVAVADPNREAAGKLAAKFKIARTVGSIEELAVGDANCAYILTPPSTHCALSLMAIGKGWHVFVEKPLAESVDECNRMIETASARGVVISVNHSDLFDPTVKRALETVRSGKIGTVLAVDIVRSSEYPPYAGGPPPGMITKGSYPFQDLGVHALYQLEAFLGPLQAVDVRFSGTQSNPNLRFDEWFTHAEGRSGVGRVHLSWNCRPMRNRLEIFGTQGSIQIDKFLQTVVLARNYPGPKFIGLVIDGLRNSLGVFFGVCGSVLRFVTGRLKPSPGIFEGAVGFAKAIHLGQLPPVDAHDGARIVALMEPSSAAADQQWSEERAIRLQPIPSADVLVTGADGFLGRALVLRLVQSGKKVRILVRRSNSRWAGDPRIQVVIGDLGDPAAVLHAVDGVTIVYHVGAAMRGYAEDFQAGTIWGTRNVLAACTKFGIERLVYVSSMSVLDHAGCDRSRPITEDATLEPKPELRGLYTQTKLTAEQMVRAAIASGDVKAVIIRPGQIFGDGTQRVTPNGVIGFGRRWVVVGHGRRTLPLVYLDDVIDALILAAERADAIGATVNVVDRTRITQRDYLQRIGASTTLGLKLIYVPNSVMLALGWMVELLGRVLRRDVPLSRYRIHSIRPLPDMDVSVAERVLGWTPRVGVIGGLDRMAAKAMD